MTIPNTDFVGNSINIGDVVDVFNHRFIAYENCEIVERKFNDDDARMAIKLDEGMFAFGLGNHDIMKVEG